MHHHLPAPLHKHSLQSLSWQRFLLTVLMVSGSFAMLLSWYCNFCWTSFFNFSRNIHLEQRKISFVPYVYYHLVIAAFIISDINQNPSLRGCGRKWSLTVLAQFLSFKFGTLSCFSPSRSPAVVMPLCYKWLKCERKEKRKKGHGNEY